MTSGPMNSAVQGAAPGAGWLSLLCVILAVGQVAVAAWIVLATIRAAAAAPTDEVVGAGRPAVLTDPSLPRAAPRPAGIARIGRSDLVLAGAGVLMAAGMAISFLQLARSRSG